MTEENTNTEKQCDINDVLERLKNLQRWDTDVYTRHDCIHEVCVEMVSNGDWIKAEDIQGILNYIKTNAL